MEDFGINKNQRTTDSAAVRGITLALNSLMDTAESAKDKKSEHINRFASILEKQVNDTIIKVQHLEEALYDPILDDVKSGSEEILSVLANSTVRFVHLQEEAKKNTEYEKLLEMNPTEQTLLNKVEEDLNIKKRLWTLMGKWKLKTSVWLATPLSGITVSISHYLITQFTNIMKNFID